MKKQFKTTKFPSTEFETELRIALQPYRGNVRPAINLLQSLSTLDCKTVVFESEYVDQDYQDEHAAFYSRAFKKYGSRTTRLHFFAVEFSQNDIPKLEGSIPPESYLGFLVLRPTDLQRVGRTILKPSPKNEDTEFIHCKAEYSAHILGQRFVVTAMPFIQQDTQVGACAQASLWMVSRYISKRFGYREFRPSEINEFAKAKSALGRALPAERGLIWRQMLDALEGMGLSALSYSARQFDDCSLHIDAALPEDPALSEDQKKEHRRKVRTTKLADIAYRYIESGLPVIFGTANHAIVGIGHTYDHAIQAKTAIQRIPAFIIHNDATGPYGTMPLFGLAAGLTFTDVEDIIAVVPFEVTLRGEAAEVMARQAIEALLKIKTANPKFPTYKEMIYQLRPEFVGLLDALEFRTFLMLSVDFQKKLRADARANQFNQALADRLMELDYPKFVWISEISSSALLNKPKRHERQCLGRVIIDSTAPARTTGEMMVHFCDLLALVDRQGPGGSAFEHLLNTTPFGHQISL